MKTKGRRQSKNIEDRRNDTISFDAKLVNVHNKLQELGRTKEKKIPTPTPKPERASPKKDKPKKKK